MQPPQRGELPRWNRVAKGVGWASERRCRLIEIILQQGCFRQHRADRQLFIAGQRRRPQRGPEQLSRFSTTAALERRRSAHEQRLQGRRRHVAEYKTEKSSTRTNGVRVSPLQLVAPRAVTLVSRREIV